MTELTIDRFTSTVRVAESDGEAGAWVCRLADRVAGFRLDQVAAKALLPQGDWFVQRVEVPLVLDLGRPTVALEEDWAQAVIDAIGAAIDAPEGDVVYYRRPADGLRDMIVSAANRNTEREWAWRQMGLLAPGEVAVATDARTAILCALRRFPRDALHTLIVAVQEVGVATLHRLLGSVGWAAVADIACRALGYPVPALRLRHAMSVEESARGIDGSRDRSTLSRNRLADAVGESSQSVERPGIECLADTIVARSTLAVAFRSAGIRPEAELLWNWAVLIGAESDPSVFARHNVTDLIGTIASQFDVRFESSGPRAGLQTATAKHELPSVQSTRADDHETVNTTDDVAVVGSESFESPWAGLLFFLNTAADADIPRSILADDVLARLPLPLILSAVATCIAPVPDSDPAVLAFSGQLLTPVMAIAMTDHEIDRVTEYAQRWIDVTLARFDVPHEERDELLRRIIERRAVIEAEPGWVEMRLDIAEVDVDVRIAGLDVDPGWVRWLGAVVRFCYV